ncbi:hypothetical protein ACLEXX_02055 [Enterobacter ludwigii]|uniref:hypothetical protein n=1 Tax=Enterobacter ludwigii TaxID=299767 RepID=UPI003976CDDB
MKQKFIEWFTKGNNGCAPAMADDGSFKYEKTQHMFEAYQAGMAESDRKVEQLAAENSSIKAMNDCLSEELRGYESDGAFDGPKMHLLWWKVETPATDAILAEVRASGVEMLAKTLEGLVAVSVTRSYITEFSAQLRQEAK